MLGLGGRFGLVGLALAVSPAAAQVAPLPPQVSTEASLKVSNTVHCAYDQMSTEDREMALLLLQREVGSERKSHAGSPNLNVIDRLVDEAQVKCAQPFAWSAGRSYAAEAYAMNELLSEGVAQAIEAKGHSPTQVESYFADHRKELAGLSEINGAQSEAFRSYLVAQGWARSESAVLAIGEYYLESLLNRESETLRFAAAPVRSVTAKAALKNPPSRARKARRGTR